MSQTNEKHSEVTAELLETIGKLVLRVGASIQNFREVVLGDLDARLSAASSSVGEGGVDPFGLDPTALKRTAIGAAFLYKVYFRCLSQGLSNVPEGKAILVANHAGQIPIDAVMITTALLLDRDPPRFVRSMMDRWVPSLPFVSTILYRG